MDDDRDLRQKLKPVFSKFDADKSGSISTQEMGKIVKAIGIEMSADDINRMMKDADPDGSGEVCGSSPLQGSSLHAVFIPSSGAHSPLALGPLPPLFASRRVHVCGMRHRPRRWTSRSLSRY